MENILLAAYLSKSAYMKVSNSEAYQFGTGDFAVTFLFSADYPGIILSNLIMEEEDHVPRGWYLELKPDYSIYFYTGDGETHAAAATEPVDTLGDGYIMFLTAQRKDGVLSIILENEPLKMEYFGEEKPCNVSNHSELVFGGSICKEMQPPNFGGTLQNITIWSKIPDSDDIENAVNNLYFFSMQGLSGWWDLNGNLLDRSSFQNSISYVDGLEFVEILSILSAERNGGYQYQSVSQGSAAENCESEDKITQKTGISVRSRNALQTQEKIKRKIQVNIEKKGIFWGACTQKGRKVIYPDGVEISVISPSGKNMKEMQSTDKQYICVEEEQVFQFILLEPELGQWSIEIAALSDSSFDFDYHYLPEGTEREEMMQVMNSLYIQYANGQRADGMNPSCFLFTSLAQIMVKDLENVRKNQLKNNRQAKVVGIDPISIGAAAILFGAAVLIIGTAYGVGKFIGWMYDLATKKDEDVLPAYEWPVLMEVIDSYFNRSYETDVVYRDICEKLNNSIPENPNQFYKRADLEALPIRDKYLHLDLGGEGCFEYAGIKSGFANAININTQPNNSQLTDSGIPFLIMLKNWNSVLPFETGMVDRITAQGTNQFTEQEIDEIARCIRKQPPASIDIWTAKDLYMNFQLDKIAKLIQEKYHLPTKYKTQIKLENKDPEFYYSDQVPGFAKYSILILEKH